MSDTTSTNAIGAAGLTATTGQQRPAIHETPQLIASDKVEGTAVYNRAGERLGAVYNFMVDKRSGKVVYAVMSFGGFLGLGASYHPLPWDVLTYDTHLGGYVVSLTREQLEGAPRYASSDTLDWTNPSYGRQVDTYYGVFLPGPV